MIHVDVFAFLNANSWKVKFVGILVTKNWSNWGTPILVLGQFVESFVSRSKTLLVLLLLSILFMHLLLL
jgi:hypothetical protein